MALSDVLQQVTIHQVWEALGSSEYKGWHGDDANWSKAFWRAGDGWNIHLLPESNTWVDFAHHQQEAENGKYRGMLGLVCLVLGLNTRAQAVQWIEKEILGLEAGSKALKPDILFASAKRWREAVVTVKEHLIRQCDDRKLQVLGILESSESETIWTHYEWLCQEQKRLRGEIDSLLTLDEKVLVEHYHQQEAQTISQTLAKARKIRQDNFWFAAALKYFINQMGQEQQAAENAEPRESGSVVVTSRLRNSSSP